jgi:hypothetical protein
MVHLKNKKPAELRKSLGGAVFFFFNNYTFLQSGMVILSNTCIALVYLTQKRKPEHQPSNPSLP